MNEYGIRYIPRARAGYQADKLPTRPVPAALRHFRALTSALALVGQEPQSWCDGAQEALAVDAASLSVFEGMHMSIPVAASSRTADEVEDIRFTLGDGPGLNARSRRPDLVDDLRGSQAMNRWPLYAAALANLTPYRAVFAFPLRIAGPPVGMLKLYRRAPGPFLDPQSGSAVAEQITRSLLSDTASPAGNFRWLQETARRRRGRVWQAQHLIMQANRLSSAQALDLLRAVALTQDRLIPALAQDIVDDPRQVPLVCS